jgi:hypothetical protein
MTEEKDFAGKVKTLGRALCPWPEWKIFWEIKLSAFYRFSFNQSFRVFDFLALSSKTGQLRIFEVKRTLEHAKRSLHRQIELDSLYADKIYVLAPRKIIYQVQNLVPDYVGLIIIPSVSKSLLHKEVRTKYRIRDAKLNPNLDPFSKFIILKDLDATIHSWHRRVQLGIEVYAEKLCKKCHSPCEKKSEIIKICTVYFPSPAGYLWKNIRKSKEDCLLLQLVKNYNSIAKKAFNSNKEN